MSPKTMMAGVVHALYDSSIRSKTIDIELIENDPDQGKKVLTAVEEGLQTCNSFFIGVVHALYDSSIRSKTIDIELIENDPDQGKKVLTAVEEGLQTCNSFFI